MHPPVAVGALVRLLPGVDLPVPVERAGVRQQFAALLALHRRLAVRPDHVRPEGEKGSVSKDT